MMKIKTHAGAAVPTKKGMSSPRPAMLVTILLTLLVRVGTLRLNVTSSQLYETFLAGFRDVIVFPSPDSLLHPTAGPARSCAD